MIYAPPFVFCPKGNPALGGSPPPSSALRETPPSGVAPLRLSLRRLYSSILLVSPSVQHPLYQSSREGENALTESPQGIFIGCHKPPSGRDKRRGKEEVRR